MAETNPDPTPIFPSEHRTIVQELVNDPLTPIHVYDLSTKIVDAVKAADSVGEIVLGVGEAALEVSISAIPLMLGTGFGQEYPEAFVTPNGIIPAEQFYRDPQLYMDESLSPSDMRDHVCYDDLGPPLAESLPPVNGSESVNLTSQESPQVSDIDPPSLQAAPSASIDSSAFPSLNASMDDQSSAPSQANEQILPLFNASPEVNSSLAPPDTFWDHSTNAPSDMVGDHSSMAPPDMSADHSSMAPPDMSADHSSMAPPDMSADHSSMAPPDMSADHSSMAPPDMSADHSSMAPPDMSADHSSMAPPDTSADHSMPPPEL